MIDTIVNALKGLPKEWITVIVAALPVSELRGSIPVGLMMGLPPIKVFLLSIAGNFIPVLPILFLLEPVSKRLRSVPVCKKFFDWLFERAKRKGDIIQKYEALGLMLFVAIPLPMTRAWTGCMAASLFKIRLKYALPAVCAGIVIAGIAVLSVCMFGKGALSIFVAK